MNIYLWLNNQQTGPYTPETLRAHVKSGKVSSTQTACVEGGSAWKPLDQLIDLSEPTVAGEPPARNKKNTASQEAIDEYEITRRSLWAEALTLLGIICLILFAFGCAAFEQSLIILGAVGAVQCFFFSFLVNVFTDIRWFLKKIAENQSEE